MQVGRDGLGAEDDGGEGEVEVGHAGEQGVVDRVGGEEEFEVEEGGGEEGGGIGGLEGFGPGVAEVSGDEGERAASMEARRSRH